MDRHVLRRSNPAVMAFVIAALVSIAILGARHQGWLERLELVAFDHYVGRIPPGTGRPRVLVVEVQEQDIQNLATYPIPDRELARAIENLAGAGARAIGIDIYRDIPVPPGSEALDAVFRSQPRVIVPSKFADDGAHGVGPPKVLAGTAQVGFNNMVLDPDGTVRRGLLYMDDSQGGVGVGLSFHLAMLYLGDEGIFPKADPDDPSVVRLGAHSLPPLPEGFGGYSTADTGGYQYALDYRGAPDAFPVMTLTELLDGAFDPEVVRDRVVTIGVAAESLTDRFRTPFGSAAKTGVHISGAALHGRMADQIIRTALGEVAPLRAPTQGHEAAMVVVSAALAAALMLWMPVGWGLAMLGFGGLGGLWALGWTALQAGWWIPVLPPALAWASSLGVVAAYSRGRERAERAEIMNLFSRHVTRSVAEDVWQHRDEFLEGGRPKPVRLTATILFIDIKGYTGNVEKMDPAELMEWIDGFLGAMAQEVLDRGGMVEDYFGDGMMACYGIPIPRLDPDGVRLDATTAVVSSLGMEQALRRLNDTWVAEGRPSVGIRVGICTGPVVAGSMGSADRLKYGVVGDAVVTAQRLESLGLDRVEHDFEKQPSRILINEETRNQLDWTFHTERVGDFKVKGKNEPVTVYRVLGRTTPSTETPPEASGGPTHE
ncbi:MAG: CHASE2 domain-containing protein [Myxococcota bacterium]